MKENNNNFLEELVTSSISKIEELSKTKTIIGDPIISPNESIIIPISKVTIGYVVGGGEYNSVSKKQPYPMCGGSGGGVGITPIGFIIETNTEIKFIDIENKTMYQTVLNLVNSVMSKINNNIKDSRNNKGMDNEKI